MSKAAVFFVLLFLAPGVPVPALAQAGSPAGPIPPDLLQARRQRLRETLEGTPAILSAAGPRGSYAQDSDYREDNNFFYLTGLEAPGACLVFNGEEEGSAVLYLPPRSPRRERWTGPTLGPGAEARALSGMEDIRSTEQLAQDLEAWLPRRLARTGNSGEALLVSLEDPRVAGTVRAHLPPDAGEPGSLARAMGALRVVKDEEEVRRLRRAVEITAEAHREVWRVAEPGLTEFHLEAALEYVFRANGAERVGFPSIVGSGPNGVVLHYDKSRRILEDGDLAVVDIGAEFGYYTADLTRTLPVSGRFTPRQAALYGLVLGARAAGLEEIRPGGSTTQVNQAVRTFLAENSGDLCGPGSCAPFLSHGVAHWLGMDVHDVGGGARTFSPGMVLTLEPGLYIPDEALGIRIEDDVLVTEAGHEVLSEALPRTVAEVEAVMREEPRWVREISPPRPGRGEG